MNKPTRKFTSLFLSTLFIGGTVLLSSCGKDDDEDSIRPEVEIPTTFSDLTPEQNKTQLEDNGIALVNSMTTFKSTSGIKTAIALNHYLSVDGDNSGRIAADATPAGRMVRLLSQFGEGKVSAADVLAGFRTQAEAETEPKTAQELFNQNAGTYTFNKQTQQFDFVAGTDKITYKFPSTETGPNNDASLIISNYTSKQVSNSTVEYTGDLPTGLHAEMTAGALTVMVYSFAADYKANGEPTSVATSITIADFKLSLEVKNTTSEVSVNYALTQNGNNLIAIGAGAAGNFTTDNKEVENLATSGSAYFQIMNIKFAGEIKDFKTLNTALDAATTKAQEATAWNNNVEFVVFYADSKKKIADTEFYVVEAEQVCEDYDDNGIFSSWECDLEPAKLDVRLIFADASKATLDTYTDTGFDDIQDELDEFIESLEADID